MAAALYKLIIILVVVVIGALWILAETSDASSDSRQSSNSFSNIQ